MDKINLSIGHLLNSLFMSYDYTNWCKSKSSTSFMQNTYFRIDVSVVTKSLRTDLYYIYYNSYMILFVAADILPISRIDVMAVQIFCTGSIKYHWQIEYHW